MVVAGFDRETPFCPRELPPEPVIYSGLVRSATGQTEQLPPKPKILTMNKTAGDQSWIAQVPVNEPVQSQLSSDRPRLQVIDKYCA